MQDTPLRLSIFLDNLMEYLVFISLKVYNINVIMEVHNDNIGYGKAVV